MDWLTLDELLTTQDTAPRDTREQDVVRRRQREKTVPRQHAYLSQTVPARDPRIAGERRRSGTIRDPK